MPKEVQLRIFHDFLYRDFFGDFDKFLRFRTDHNPFAEELAKKRHLQKMGKFPKSDQHFKQFQRYPFYSYRDAEYSNFILALMQTLEPRFFKKQEIIFNELDEVGELYFVLEGNFDVGYEINNKKIYRLRFKGKKNIIGIFNVITNIRS